MSQEQIVSKSTIRLVMAMVAFSLIVVTVAVLMPSEREPAVPADAQRLAELTFADRADGGIDVTGSAGLITLEPDTNGFIRGVVRALARERRINELGPETPFVLYADNTGHLGLADPETGARVHLRAFGEDNERAFIALIGPATLASVASATGTRSE